MWPFGNPITGALNKIMTWMVGLITGSFTDIFKAVKGMLVSTPDVTQLPQVQMVTARTVNVIDVVFVLAFLAAGAMIMIGGSDEKSRYTVKTLMPRMIVAFIAAHFSPLFCSKIIGLADGIATSLAGGSPNKMGALTAVGQQIVDGSNGSNGGSALLFAVLAAIITFLFTAVAFSFLTRLGVLVIIAVTGPLALACHAVPQLEPTAKLWWRSLAGCLAIPMLQVLALQSGETILLNPQSQGFLFGVPGGGVMNLLIVITLLWITVKIPGLVRKNVMQSNGSGFGAQVLRVVVIQQGMRLLTGGASSAARVARSGMALAAGR
jgi:TrbL/VirB6 plasmid conjugal transfer protein